MITTVDQRSTERGADDYERFCRQVQTHTGLDLSAYKRNQMERRIRAMADREGITRLDGYWELLQGDAPALRTFLDRVTINVSEFFRNPEKFEELRKDVIPELLSRRKSLLVWSAGCSYGAEPYSLWILLHGIDPRLKHRVMATDIDNGVLARAREGVFSEDDLKNMPSTSRRRFFTAVDKGYAISPDLRGGVEFKRHDLLRDPFPKDVDLILCRNVVIYFSDETKDRLFSRFYDALVPGGYLLVGSTERIANAREIGFYSSRPFFYQKPG